MHTKPPIFKKVEELLHADEWLNTIKQKFRLLSLMAEYFEGKVCVPPVAWSCKHMVESSCKWSHQ
jgi:hypothetical protein